MPTFNAALIPSIAPGDLFDRLFADSSLGVRWLAPTDPAYYETLNRPHADIVLRQLIIAKAIDRINDSIGYLSAFPFVIQPRVENGSQVANIPLRIFWDCHISLPDKWSNVRLARVDRLDGENDGSGGPDDTGTIRFIFTGNERTDGTDSSTETVLFYLDYQIDSSQTYQIARPQPADVPSGLSGFSAYLATSEASTLGGTCIFKTADTTSAEMEAFLVVVAPAASAQSYEVSDTVVDGTDAYSNTGLNHGTGLLASSAYNGIVTLESDPLNWVEAFNYPFDLDADRTSEDTAVVIPSGLFTEFNITAPAGDNATGETDGLQYPVWISKLVRDGDDYTLTFSTYNVTDSDPSSSDPVEFATMTLTRTMAGGQIVAIEPEDNLLLFTGGDAALAIQHFGRGHVVLSRKWDTSGGVVDDFFNSLPLVPSGGNEVTFGKAATRISSFGVSRVPKYTPTLGQSQALRGSSARFSTPVHPSSDNRFVTEADEGLGDAINLDTETGITPDSAISAVGYAATRSHKLVKLVIDQSRVSEDDVYYETHVLPRLTILFGRAPIFGDVWYNGNHFLRYNGNAWIG